VYVLGMVFFSAKYAANMRTERNNFYRFVNIVANISVKVDTITTSTMTRAEMEFLREP
jgi:hypothetical protein